MSDNAAPQSTLPYPPIHKDAKFVVLSDWDGTITTHDSNDYMTDNLGYGLEKRRNGNLSVLAGEVTFRDEFRKMLGSVVANGHSFEECKQVLRDNIKLDEGFKPFYSWCKEHGVPVIIVSSGMTPTIRAVLSNLLGEQAAEEIEIISNDVDIKEDGTWEIKFRHPSSGFGHDKSQAILPYRALPNPPTLFFFGDGVSDMSAAAHADLLFVKTKYYGENDLHEYCKREKIPHVLIGSFAEAMPLVQAIVEGKKTVQEVIKEKGWAPQ